MEKKPRNIEKANLKISSIPEYANLMKKMNTHVKCRKKNLFNNLSFPFEIFIVFRKLFFSNKLIFSMEECVGIEWTHLDFQNNKNRIKMKINFESLVLLYSITWEKNHLQLSTYLIYKNFVNEIIALSIILLI